ncbi:MAG: hypothetical protein Q7K40_01105, partial [bacterium]|nr:hypothetical protein [bacterium]
MKKFIYIIILTVALSGVLSASAETASTEVSASGSTGTASTTLRAKLQAELELRQTNIKNTVEERKDAVGAVRTETKDKNTLLRQSNKTLIQTGVKENKGAILENRA